MKAGVIKEIFLFLVLVVLQVFLLDRINIFGVATPILYIYFLLKLTLGRNRFYVIITGFLLGLIIDIFMNTPGMNAAATTIIAAFREPIIKLIYTRDAYDELTPGINTDSKSFIRLSISVVLFHQTLLFIIESFTLFNIQLTLLRIVASSILTLLIIFAVDALFGKKSVISEF
ncbi:MAG: rod shape-determining protein MreD [Dysgonamonadaceae bacterium]